MTAVAAKNVEVIKTETNTPLPPLRQELSLHLGTPASDGSPTWTLQDPVSNRFYQLGWQAFEILSRWSLGDPRLVVDAVNTTTTLTVDHNDVMEIFGFLRTHHLLRATTAEDNQRLNHYQKASRLTAGQWLLHNYLFFRLPLVRPDRLLRWLAPAFNYVFKPAFWWGLFGILVWAIYLVSRQWDQFTHTFASYLSPEGFISIAIALSIAKIIHELGHALTAHHYGCRVPTMGVAFLVLMPMLYTDTNEAWKLWSRRARLQIGAAGMLAEMVLAVLATLAWSFLPEGPIRAGAFLLATSTWVLTLAINASPFMRFDGYFIFADYLNMANLHERALALARWSWREFLFGWGDPKPEIFSRDRERFLILFSLATVIYRAIIFLTIAFMVYHLFFKLLGILLMLVELGWFIFYPVKREVAVWWQRRAEMRWHKPTYRSLGLLVSVLAILLVPWQSGIRAPALIMAEQAQGIYSPHEGQVVESKVERGQRVETGQILAILKSPELEYQSQLAEVEAEHLRLQWQQQSLSQSFQNSGAAFGKRFEAAQQKLNIITERRKQLTLSAPFAGVVVGRNDSLTPQNWISANEKLFQIVGEGGIKGEAFITEADALRLQQYLDSGEPDHRSESSTLTFIANQPGFPRLNCRISGIDNVNINQLDYPYLASSYGGSIPTQLENSKPGEQGKLTPLDSRFRLRFQECVGSPGTQQELAGVAMVYGENKNIVSRVAARALALWNFEAGF